MIVGIDYGSKRVGIAVSSSGVLASPHSVLRNETSIDDLIERLARLSDELEATEFVLGVPAGSRHDREAITQRFEQIAERLRQRTCKPVTLWDESYSTHEASERRRDAGKSWKSAKKEIDREAAAVILQTFLDARTGGRS